MKFLPFLLAFLISLMSLGQVKSVTITVDDLTTVHYGDNSLSNNLYITESLVAHFTNRNIPAVGFVNESKLYEGATLNESWYDLLEMWPNAGLELGNHTYSHFSFHKVSFESYTTDVLKGEKHSVALSAKYDIPFRYFRHPYLHAGNSVEKADSLNTFLRNNDYQVAPVTFDTNDWQFASGYQRALSDGDTLLATKIGESYVEYNKAMIQYFEELTELIFGKQIPQILLIHASRLNADYLDDLLLVFEDFGYQYDSLESVLSNPAYQQPDAWYGNSGISWLERWALGAKIGIELIRGVPQVSDFLPRQ